MRVQHSRRLLSALFTVVLTGGTTQVTSAMIGVPAKAPKQPSPVANGLEIAAGAMLRSVALRDVRLRCPGVDAWPP